MTRVLKPKKQYNYEIWKRLYPDDKTYPKRVIDLFLFVATLPNKEAMKHSLAIIRNAREDYFDMIRELCLIGEIVTYEENLAKYDEWKTSRKSQKQV